jgi:hypothetical protein
MHAGMLFSDDRRQLLKASSCFQADHSLVFCNLFLEEEWEHESKSETIHSVILGVCRC